MSFIILENFDNLMIYAKFSIGRTLKEQQKIDYLFLELTTKQKEYNDYVLKIVTIKKIIFES